MKAFICCFIIACFAFLNAEEGRVVEIENLIKRTEKVLEKIQDKEIKKEAKELIDFIKEHKIAMMPVKNNSVVLLEKPKRLEYVGILLLKQEDKNIQNGALWANFVNTRSFAMAFNKEKKTIVVKDNFFSNEYISALLFLHEIFHALEYFKNPNNDFINEEIAAHTFESRILRGLYGKGYEAELRKEIDRIQKAVGKYKTIKEKLAYLPDRVSNINLDKAFGIKDIVFSKMIASALWINAIFSLAEETKQPQLKRAFLEDLYERQNM